MLQQHRRLGMGTYVNPGRNNFQMSVNSEIFVDKTEMIAFLNTLVNTQQRYASVSRPRRFGKSMAVDMLCAYYDRGADSRKVFEKRKLAASAPVKNGENEIPWDAYLGKFDVIRLVMTDFFKQGRKIADGIRTMTSRILEELEEMYPGVRYDPNDLIYSMDRFYRKSGIQFVILIDEWDAVFRIQKEDRAGQTEYLDFLRDWMKDKPYIALAYMTGILPIKKYGRHSALNMFTEYSMMFPRQAAKYTGFTEEEVFSLCNRYGRDYDAVKNWYDGYAVSDVVPPDPDHEEQKATGIAPKAARYELYSPLSVVEAMTTGVIRDYWNETETYEALAEYIRKDFDGLKDAVALLMDGGRLKVDTSTYQNDMTTFHGRDDVLSLLIHLGYLGFNDERSEVFIPNRVSSELPRKPKNGKVLSGLMKNLRSCSAQPGIRTKPELQSYWRKRTIVQPIKLIMMKRPSAMRFSLDIMLRRNTTLRFWNWTAEKDMRILSIFLLPCTLISQYCSLN